MLEVLFRLLLAGGLMVGSAQLPPLLAQSASGVPSHALEGGHPQPLRGVAAATAYLA